ncbi:MAG: tRNA 4-thiouridine(8) synthase ThiI [Lachnospiraceae bacterium]|nr:tRNA 4-thiouridine(8) synthase ThiI [Lachnospiraceae bacterium]MBP3568984.1 tRNA 4-thiouridine(8) synthase ThiI [Lachnospiraceae bacterium]
MYKAFLIKYAEIGLKGKNRHVFENILRDQIQYHLDKLGAFEVTREQGRIFVSCPEVYDFDETIEELQKVFGVAGICPVVVVESTDWDVITAEALKYVDEFYEDKNFTFKVEAKRADKRYPITSPEMCRKLGESILYKFMDQGIKVDVHDPKVRIWVEVRNKSYIYSHIIPGPGGMPVGSGGKGMLLLSGGIDSPVAGYMIAKRGVALEATYFHAPPYTSERAKQKVVDLAKIISAYTGPIKLNIVNFTDIQLYIYEQCPHEQLTIIMRRYMMRIAEKLALDSKCLGLVTGESIGQVASQTMQSLVATNAVCTLPVYRPLIAFDKQDIVTISEKIKTYETSILPYEDCCTIFVAKHPVTHPILSVIEKSETHLEEKIEEMIKEALDTIEVVQVG